MVNTPEFRNYIKIHLRPRLAELGFKGTDHHFYKETAEHFIYTLTIQANKYSGSCILELGVHLDFLPNTVNEKIEIKKITTYDCEFRKRIGPEISWFQKLIKREHSTWFEYGKNESDAIITIKKMFEIFIGQGFEYFKQFTSFPEPIISIQLPELIERSNRLDNLSAPSDLRMALLIARTHKYLGNNEEAKKYVTWGLNNIGKASGLIESFNKVNNS